MSTETMQFKTELKQLLHLIIHSLYSHKDIFLRELISNASDAIDRVRFQGLTQPELLEGNADWKIKLIPDETAGTLTISDNGVGMSRETIVEHLGTIARSGTREFLESLQARRRQGAARADRPVRRRLLLRRSWSPTRSPSSRAWPASPRTASSGNPTAQGDFTVEPSPSRRAAPTSSSTCSEDAKDFLQSLAAPRSSSRSTPISSSTRSSWTSRRRRTARRRRSRKRSTPARRSGCATSAEITEDEYNEFYKHLAHDTQNPLQDDPLQGRGADRVQGAAVPARATSRST